MANAPEEQLPTTPVQPALAHDEQPSLPPNSGGFRARLEGLSLFDLVQMECLARSHRVVRVTSSGRVGYLYFRGGEIVHAGTRNLVGERAALEIMGWNDGVFEPCHIVWPERTTITTAWQRLLLIAAKARDDHAAGKLVHLPSRRSSPPPDGAESCDVDDDMIEEIPRAASTPPPPRRPSSAPPAEPAGGSGGESLASSLEQAVRIDPQGNVLAIVGSDPEFGGFAAYARRLGELIGKAFGLERFAALEVGLETSRCLVYVEEKGNVVAVKAKNAIDLGSVARRAGL